MSGYSFRRIIFTFNGYYPFSGKSMALFIKRISFIYIVAILLYACEFKLDEENIVDIDPPPPNRNFQLDITSYYDTVRIFDYIVLNYSFHLDGTNIREGYFKLGNKEWHFGHYEGNFFIQPENNILSIDTLSLKVFTSSGTGSVADYTGSEGYIATRNWVAVTDTRMAPPATCTRSITEKGFLKISWNVCNNYNFDYYLIELMIDNHIESRTIGVRSTNFIIDSLFIGGNVSATVMTKVLTGSNITMGNNLRFTDPAPVPQFEDISPDSIRVYWRKSPYFAKYHLTGSGFDVPESTDTSVMVPFPGFGKYINYTLTTLPNRNYPNITRYNRSNTQIHSLGKLIASNWPLYAYSKADKVVYTNSNEDLLCYSIDGLELNKSLRINNLMYAGYFSCASNSSRVAAQSSDNIYIFNDKTLSNPIIIPYNCSAKTIDHFCLTDNGLITLAYKGNFQIISIAEKKIIKSITLPDYPVASSWACITTSRDGKYACIATKNGIYLYSIEGDTPVLVYSDNRSYRSVYFDDDIPGRLLITLYNSDLLEIRNASDFSLVSNIILPTTSEVISNIDPETGYLMLTDYLYIYIINMSNGQVLLKMKSNDSRPQLYNNRLFSNNGYGADITPFLTK